MMTIAQMSLAGAVMILAVAVIRAIAVDRLPKRTFIILWELVLLRLLVPFSIPSVTSVYTLFAGSSTQQAYEPAGEALFPEADLMTEHQPTGYEQGAGAFPVMTAIYISGAALCAAGFATLYLLAYRRFRYAETVKDGYAAEWLNRQGLRRKATLRLSGKISSPLTYGILRPVILLPSDTDMNDRRRLTFILAHELTHIRRLDILRKLIAAAAVCVHWFDPAVWIMYLLFNRDIELACDEAVIRKSGADCRSEYAKTLIDMEEKRGRSPSLNAYFSKNAVEERIAAVMKTRKTKILTSALACVIIAVVAGTFATSAYEEVSGLPSSDIVQPVSSEAVSDDPPETVWGDDSGTFSTENSGFEVVYLLSEEQKQRLREKYDISKMRAKVNGSYTREYLAFRDELVSMNVFTSEQTERFFLISVPAHTGVLSGPLGETDIKEASNIVEELENAIEKQKTIIAYISEKSQDPERSQPEDFEYLEKAGSIAIKQMFRDLLYDLMR